jgi:hypothetical protein
MINQIIADANIHAGDGGHGEGTQEKHDEFVKIRNQSLGKMRIKELMKIAGSDVSGKWMSIDNSEKFAELIIKECGVALSPMLRDMVSRGHAYNLVKQHFGVEE